MNGDTTITDTMESDVEDIVVTHLVDICNAESVLEVFSKLTWPTLLCRLELLILPLQHVGMCGTMCSYGTEAAG